MILMPGIPQPTPFADFRRQTEIRQIDDPFTALRTNDLPWTSNSRSSRPGVLPTHIPARPSSRFGLGPEPTPPPALDDQAPDWLPRPPSRFGLAPPPSFDDQKPDSLSSG